MKNNALALALILLAALWRIVILYHPMLFNVAPITALAFCGAVYFRDWRLALVPFAALTLSDLWLDHYHAATFGYSWSMGQVLLRALCVVAALGLGRLVEGRRNALTILGGATGSALIFYFVTNSAAWFGDAFYAKTAAGWWQAMTIGHPEFPPTLWFLRNTLAGDLAFTALFAGAMELAARGAATVTRRIPG